ncbi:hypothetical protein B0H14DRAFT_2746921 [Mycena olivaceomarginata]|nr:hypothetical protein B0H14DRAFT_2746921 [Mycena olivaceomarginata]
MFSNLKLLLPLGFLTVSLAADIFTYKIRDFQGSMLDLTNACSESLTPVQSSKKTTEKSQNAIFILQWMFIYAAHGDTNEYRVMNIAVPSILSYTTAPVNSTTPAGAALHAQITGNTNVGTFWDVVFVKKNSTRVNFIEKATGLAMTAWPAGKRSGRSSPVSLPPSLLFSSYSILLGRYAVLLTDDRHLAHPGTAR